MSVELENETASGDAATRTRRVRILQAYTHAIQDMEDSTDDEDEEEDSAFELFEVADPITADETSEFATQSRRFTRGRGLQRQRTISDAMEDIVHTDEDMAPYKLANLLFHGSVAGTLPYFTLYSKQLGLDAAQVGIVCGIRPLLVSIVAPLVGWLADKYHMRRICAILCTSLWILFALLIAVVPPPTLAKCDVALQRLHEFLHSENMSIDHVDMDCKTRDHYQAVNSLSRHLFLDEVIFWNGTSVSCNNSTNNSILEPATSITYAANETVFLRRIKTTDLEVYDIRQVYAPEDEETVSKHEAQDGSWLFTDASLRDAFISAFILASFAEMMQVSSISLVDVVTLDSLGRGVKREGYAWQRAFGVTGYVVFSIIIVCILAFSSTIVSICGVDVKFLDYKITFVIFAGMMACGFAVIISIKFKYEDSHRYRFRVVLNVLATMRFGSMLFTAFFLALCNGCINTFLLWHLESLGATNLIFILAFIAFGVSEVATSYYLPVLVRTCGHAGLVLLGVWIYCFMFICYALMGRPYWVVIIEIFHGAAFALTWNPITTYLTGAVCREYLATMQGILTGTYYGLGNVIGSMCAGLSVQYNGTAMTFYGFAVMCLVYGILFLVVNRETGLLHNCRKQQRRYETTRTDTE